MGTSSEVGEEIISGVILGDEEGSLELKHPWVSRVREFGHTFALSKGKPWRSDPVFGGEELRRTQRAENPSGHPWLF